MRTAGDPYGLPDIFPLDLDAAARLAVAPGFTAIVPSDRLAPRITGAIRDGGRVIVAAAGAEIVGYASVVPFRPIAWQDEIIHRRWEALPAALELGALEVAAAWRRSGVGSRLLGRVVAEPAFADRILVAQALAWHWDLDAAGATMAAYRAFLRRALERAGFRVFATDDPEVADHPASFLAARIGDAVPAAARDDFERLLHAHDPMERR
jgi:acetoin utilization protein AcuA